VPDKSPAAVLELNQGRQVVRAYCSHVRAVRVAFKVAFKVAWSEWLKGESWKELS